MRMMKMDDRSRYRLIFATSVMVTVGVLAFLLLITLSEPWEGDALLPILIIGAIVVLLPIVLLLKTRREVKEGIPLVDERGRVVRMRAGYYAFMATIYIVLAFMYYDFIFVDVLEAPALSPTEYFLVLDFMILGVYLVFWWWFSKKGD